MPDRTEIRRGIYQDSVVLMQISDRVRRLDGISDCIVAMATAFNLALLAEMGFATDGAADAATSDMIVAVRGADTASLQAAADLIDESLQQTQHSRTPHASPDSRHTAATYGTIRTAIAATGAKLAVLSVPGEHVVSEAADALVSGANVMIFSDGVSMQHERRLKLLAEARGLLVMGPDCGTAVVDGVGLGFANEVTSGSIGIVAASGTGAQQLMCLLDASGAGISHVLGVGGRDLSDDIGGVSTIRALQMLDEDPCTEHIVVVSKPPGERTAQRIAQAAAASSTPVTLGLLGAGTTLTELAMQVAAANGREPTQPLRHVQDRTVRPGPLAGLFSGGTLAIEAAEVISTRRQDIGPVEALGAATPVRAIASCGTNFVVDLGDDRFTAGRPHPMIDPAIRCDLIEQLANRPQSRHLFVDVVLGHVAHPDPAAALAPPLKRFLNSHPNGSAVVSLIGTDRDPQDLTRQHSILVDAGCDVFESNTEAATEVAARLSPPADPDTRTGP